MIDEIESLPKSNLGLIDKGSLSSLDEWAICPTLKFEPEILGHEKWQEMLGLTKQDGLERGLTVAFDGKKLITGKVYQGTKDSIHPDLFPHGIRSVFSRREKNLVSIHTHPMHSELDHVQTVPISDKDINSFISSTFKAMLTIDRGGVHLLTRKPYSKSIDPDEESKHKITEESLRVVRERENTAISVMKEIAKKLRSLGVEYYYSPNLATTQDGLVELSKI